MKQPTLGVPCLPGYKIANTAKSAFHKLHTLDYYNGYSISKSAGGDATDIALDVQEDALAKAIEASSAKLQFGHRAGPYSSQHQPPREAVEAAQIAVPVPAPFVPSFAALDKIVLRFDAYLKETLPDGNRGPLPGATHSDQDYVIRHVMILYYVEDDSIAVVEPPVENSGLPQGVLIKRQWLPKPINANVGAEVQYYSLADFQLATDVHFYGKTYRIVGCDVFTENYLRDVLQKPLSHANPAELVPVDPYLEARARAKRLAAQNHHSADAAPHADKLKKFLENDRKVLRFYCMWDDRESLYGEVREFVIHYFLVDDCMEVREVQKTNSGRDPFPIMLRRQMLPRQVQGLTDLAGTTPLGTDLDVESYKNKATKFYTWRDIRLGSTLNVLGRQFLVYDCDDYTRSFYVAQGKWSNDVKSLPLGSRGKQAHAAHRDEVEHPEANAQEAAVEQVPKKNGFYKMLANEGKVLRFAAHLESHHKEDLGRRFVIVYRLADDTMSIYEPPIRNAGIMGGKFMARACPVNPETKKAYQPNDLYVGAIIEAYRHKFILYDADEFVFKWMEERSKEFPQSDLAVISPKVKALPKAQLQAAFEKAEQTPMVKKPTHAKGVAPVAGELNRDTFLAIVKTAAASANVSLNEHEILTYVRQFPASVGKCNFRGFIANL